MTNQLVELFLFLGGLLADRHDPDIAELDGVIVILQEDRAGGVGFLFAAARRAGDFSVVMNQFAVPIDGDVGVFDLLAVLEFGGMEGDVVRLPFARRLGHVLGRGFYSVHGTAFALGVGFIVVAVENLKFVTALLIDAAVASILRFEFRPELGLVEFQVELVIGELFLGVCVGLGGRHGLILHGPLGRPMGCILPIKQHDRIVRLFRVGLQDIVGRPRPDRAHSD